MITSRYYLENGGERISLMNAGGNVHFVNVEGLGTTTANKYIDFEQGFFPRAKEKFSQERIVGTLRFINDAFNEYRTIVDFIENADELCFVYSPYSGREYYRRVDLSSITKGKRDSGGVMFSTLTLNCLTPWYLAQPVELAFSDGSATTYFQYDTTAWGTAPYLGNRTEGFSTSVETDGHLPADVVVEYIGSANNPIITLSDENRNVLGTCKITYSLNAGDKLVLSTRQNDSFCTLTRAGAVIDMLPFIDLTEDPFFRIPTGKRCTIKISSSTLNGTATVKVYSYYRSV